MILETEESAASSAADGEIIGIQFGLASHHEIRTSSISDCPISHASQLANPFLGLPLEIGKCESCGTAEPGQCEGHFGYIELPVPVYHPSHISELKRMLSLICLKCLKMKTSKAPSKSNGVMERLLSACCEEACHVSIKEVKSNEGSSFLELKIPGRSRVHDGAWNFLSRFGYKYGDGSSRTLLASEVLAMLRKLREDTKRKLAKKGYFAQDGYIVTYLPVPPNCLSVPDVSDGVSVMSSDLCSSMLKKVLRQIDLIRSSRSGEPNFEAHEVEANDLQLAISQYLEVRGTSKAARDGDKRFGVSKDAGSSSTKAWLDKMRTLFISKGSGFSSRSVITGDAFRPVNEVGIPTEIAQKMTFEERVNVHNIQYLQRLVDNNLCLTFRDGSATYSLKEGSKGHTFLRIGQVVHRRIMDGDVVFINRPPTTHKHSLQALSVYIHDDHVVKINPLMCGPLAADFDGDCVHLFYPQSLSARAEVLELFSVDKQLLSSHSGNLNLQLSTDALLSLKMIFYMCFMDKASAQQLAMHSSSCLPSPAVRKACSSGPRWSAQQILQTALPPQFECQGERLLIRGSEILKLDFNRDVIASVISDVLTSLFFSKSPKHALNFFDSLQPLLMENIFSEGFSVSLGDFFVPFAELEGIQTQIQDTISPLLLQLRSSFNELIQLQFESCMKLLKVPISNFILKSSALGNLIDSRSESAIDKIVQQIGFLGLQLSDKRKFYSKSLVEEMGSLFKLKHPFAGLYPSEECGLVRSCFFRGLDAYQEMVHSIATREIIVRSSKGLAEPGTLFKNLMAVLRDVVICYDGTVRNVSSNSVIQFEYGLEGVTSQSLFPAGEPVGVLAATAMSNPAYKAVLDSSPSSNSSWDMMKEILFCRANFKNDLNDRRVILYLNDCTCGRNYCQENASYVVKNHLKKVSLRDAAVEFLIEYKRPKAEPGSTDVESGLVGHIHLNSTLLRESKIVTHDILQKCEEQVSVLRKKKKYGHCFKRMSLSVSECCHFPHSGSKWTDMPCLKFFWEDMTDPHIEKISHIMADLICPVLLDTVIKGDPRISTVNIVWINPGTTSWVPNSSDRKGELAVEVTLEKMSVRQSGDAWRIVLDCCLPVFHLIDTRRSIPYAIKQIQDLIGICCAFDQAVQRLSTSVTLVTRGVLKEHLILLASSMTCSGNLVGFNISGIKALCRALSAQVPFTEATLYTPRRCFERASEKRHVDSLAGIVASCSWGKRVAVGTGTKFEILWDTTEIKTEQEPIDVYSFLHLVRSSNGEEMETDCLGEDVEEFGWEDGHKEPPLSPENEAVFDDIIDSQEQVQLDNKSGSGGWDLPKSQDSANGNDWLSWGSKKEQSQPEDASKSVGWGAPKTQDSGKEKEKNIPESSDDWGSKKPQGTGSNGWSSKDDGGWTATRANQQEETGGWGSEKKAKNTESSWKPNHEAGSGSGMWGSQKEEKQAPPSSSEPKISSGGTGGWSSDITNKESGSKSWDSKIDDPKNQSSWGKSNTTTQSTWGQPKSATCVDNKETNAWSSDKSGQPVQSSSWGSGKTKPNSSGNPVDNSVGAWSLDSKKDDTESQSSWGKANSSTWKNSAPSVNEWGSKKSDQQQNSSSQHAKNTEVGESKNITQSTWGQPRNTAAENNNQTNAWSSHDTKNNEVGASGSWESRKGQNNTQSTWGQPRNAASVNDKETNAWSSGKSGQVADSSSWGSGKAEPNSSGSPLEDSSGGWGSKTVEKKTQSSWGRPKSSVAADEWGPGKAESDNSAKTHEDDSSGGWGSKTVEKKTQSSWGRPKSSVAADEWGPGKAESDNSAKTHEDDSSGGWGSKTENTKSQSSWGQKSDSTWKSSPSDDGWGSTKVSQPDQPFGRGSGRGENGGGRGWGAGRGDSGGGRGWGSSNSGEWKSRKNRPPKQPGSNDDVTNVAMTATRKPMHIFPSDEQEALSEVETIMQSIRRIMHQSGCNDGDPLPSDDQSYIINNVLEHHPDKAVKIGAGIDYITVKKHGNFQDSRCFFVVSTDGKAEDFSYIKCLENFVKGKHPAIAESFNSKYFRKPQPRVGGNRQRPESPNSTQNSPDSPNLPESPNTAQNPSES